LASWTEHWENGFAALSKFRAREGHCFPSRHHVEGKFSLGAWVSTQRYYLKRKLLSAERKRRLDAIGFVWDWQDLSLGAIFCGAFEVQTTKGTQLRADLSRRR